MDGAMPRVSRSVSGFGRQHEILTTGAVFDARRPD
jgi:hypothetical protein